MRFWRLRRCYESALKKAAKERGDPQLAETAIQILREGFFDEQVKRVGVSVEKEFNEFLKRLRERLPQSNEDALQKFLEDAYDELATELEGDEQWGKRSEEITSFLRQRGESKP